MKKWVGHHKPDFVPSAFRLLAWSFIWRSPAEREADSYLRRMRLLPGVIHPSACAGEFAARRAFLLFCLAPHGVCHASFIAVGAVGSYPAFSPLPSDAKGFRGRFVFCDTFHCPGLPQNLRRLRAACCLVVSGLSSHPQVPQAALRRATTPADPSAPYFARIPCATRKWPIHPASLSFLAQLTHFYPADGKGGE
jgi:hypothetical protein